MSKYGNQKTIVDGIKFDSKHEAYRYVELKLMERTGLIKNLRLQVPFELIPNLKDKNGKLLERKATYVADFVYELNGQQVVEDAKGCRTDVYKLKKKLMLERYGIVIVEV